MTEVKAKVPYHSKNRKGLHDVIMKEIRHVVHIHYEDPTQTLPKPPLIVDLKNWWTEYEETVDDLILRSNVHSCMVDPEDGVIRMKKREAMINCISPGLTYCLRCNTDVTSLLSGTSIKAVVAYISDYVIKASLKIYHIFHIVKDVLNKNTENMGSSAQGKENTRVLVMQMVNSLSSKSPEFENTSLFNYFQMANQVKSTKQQYNDFMKSLRNRDPDVMMDVQAVGPDDNDWLVDDGDQTTKVETLEDPSDAVSIHSFQEGHGLYETHCIRCDRRNLDKAVSNFLGVALPRKDLSDREFYCCEKALTFMKNFNVKYECNNARDDFASQDRQRSRPVPMFSRWRDAEEVEDSDGGDLMGYGEDDYDPPAKDLIHGPRRMACLKEMETAENLLTTSTGSWSQQRSSSNEIMPRFVPKQQLSGEQWKIRVASERQILLDAEYKHVPLNRKRKTVNKELDPGNKATLLNSYYLTKYSKAKNKKLRKWFKPSPLSSNSMQNKIGLSSWLRSCHC
ncbi:hypothetical protein B0H17DRAFT_1147456 [Mycena rosella]|uniref:Uncharacterized protein n=1 Tax=Mycena rosella TaxID=1033263 RepID=A0AAD7FZS0_MYCRO|nr:hypothetical protein B0H17DRAFT_1147456 [Mycena rosella]